MILKDIAKKVLVIGGSNCIKKVVVMGFGGAFRKGQKNLLAGELRQCIREILGASRTKIQEDRDEKD